MSDSDAAEEHGQPAAPAGILFTDHFAGTTESLPHIPLLPDEQAALVQVTRPLQLMRAAKWFVGRRWPAAGRQRLPQQPLPPLDCVRDGCAARVPARAMFGWVATACGRLASAPGDGTTWRLAGWVMECVSRGGVRRVQVQPQRRAAVSRHMCVFCNRLLQQTLADVQVAHCKAPQQHAPRCRTPCFPAHALFAVCRRRQPRTLRCARQTRGERSPALNLRAQRLAPDPPPLLQLYKGFIYTSAHVHDVDGQTIIKDGCTPVGIDAGFEVAPGDASDIEVANAHAWGSLYLIFSDGRATGSALQPSFKGIASYFCK